MEPRKWSKKDLQVLQDFLNANASYRVIACALDRSVDSIKTTVYKKGLRRQNLPLINDVPESIYPAYNEELQSDGDFLVIPDLEAPFHHAEFVNRVLDLAHAWGITKVCLAGDALHYESLSSWGAAWVSPVDGQTVDLIEYALTLLDPKRREKARRQFERIGVFNSGDYSDELAAARVVLKAFDAFDEVYCLLGNHEDRFLRALDRALKPREILRQVDRAENEKWKIAPYYYMTIETPRGLFRVTHPKSAAANAAIKLAVQYQQNVLMAHSHRWAVQRDPSGRLWAIQMGHCVDEERLAYVAQRDANRDAHSLGAVILRNGFPYVLSQETDWDSMKGL